ncbi:hypothetical protein CYY_004680 [Polysphondylium violaceum]|uniref:WDR59/RTC1-like RING zinc finger domain-containing protein n=1 Tax=Polysphondylium violaceum TaxID=133409 RepID=A0A8J4PXN4_9MYCE|nr:hypothetical protein CYY_004680 [Polysphondylium violaceum]
MTTPPSTSFITTTTTTPTPTSFLNNNNNNNNNVINTFQHNYNVKFYDMINSITVNKAGNLVCLGGKKSLQIIDLESLKNVKNILQQSTWDVNVVDWNNVSPNLIASSSNSSVFVWDLENSKFPLLSQFQSHSRAISDLSWSLFDQNILATTSADSFINIWDLRSSKKAMKIKSLSSHILSAVQVKWNKFNSNVLASAHEGNLKIWDLRADNKEFSTTVHSSKVYGIDWSPHVENEIMTCSQDKSIKIWNYPTAKPKQIITTGHPVLRAKYLPIGNGIVTISDRGENHIRLWDLKDLQSPVGTLIGHTDNIRAFDFRVKNNSDTDQDLQIVSWSKDQYLRLWKLDNNLKDTFNIDYSNQLPLLNNTTSPATFGQIGTPEFTDEYSGGSSSIGSNSNGGALVSNLNHSLFNISKDKDSLINQPIFVNNNSNNNSNNVDSNNSNNNNLLQTSPQLYHIATNSTIATTADLDLPKDLDLELKMITSKPISKYLKIEQINLNTRTCVVTCSVPNNYNNNELDEDELEETSGNNNNNSINNKKLIAQSIDSDSDSSSGIRGYTTVQINVSFPYAYPNKAAPNFGCNIYACNTSLKTNIAIQAALHEISLQRVQKNLPCFEQCLNKLLTMVKEIVLESNSSNNVGNNNNNNNNTSPSSLLDSSFHNEDKNDNVFKFDNDSNSNISNSNSSSSGLGNSTTIHKNYSLGELSSNNSGGVNRARGTFDKTDSMPMINLRSSNSRIETLSAISAALDFDSNIGNNNNNNNNNSNNPKFSKSPNSPRIFEQYKPSKPMFTNKPGEIIFLNNYKDPNEEQMPLSPILNNFANNNSNNNNNNNNNSSNNNSGWISSPSNNTFNTDFSLSSHRNSLKIPEGFPCPRICGVAFGGNNKIIVFKRKSIVVSSSSSSSSSTNKPSINISSPSLQLSSSPSSITPTTTTTTTTLTTTTPNMLNTTPTTTNNSNNSNNNTTSPTIVLSEIKTTPRTYKELLQQINSLSLSGSNAGNEEISNNPSTSLHSTLSSSQSSTNSTTPSKNNILSRELHPASPLLNDMKSNNIYGTSPSPLSTSPYNINNNINNNSNEQNMNDNLSTNSSPILSSKPYTPIAQTIRIYDISPILPLNYNLACSYVLNGKSIEEVCNINKQLAIRENRKDLVKLWDFIKNVTDPKLYIKQFLLNNNINNNNSNMNNSKRSFRVDFKDQSNNNMDDNSWPNHPLGRTLVKSYIEHYKKLGDIQTLAVLSCILVLSAHQLQKVKNYFTNNESMAHQNILMNGSLSNLSIVLGGIDDNNNHNNNILFRTSSTSTPTKGNSIVSNNNNNNNNNSNIGDLTNYDPNLCLLDPSQSKIYDYYRNLYSDVLYRWELLEKRAEVLKFIQHREPERGIYFAIECTKCFRKLPNYYCDRCKIYAVKCSICNISVRGLSSFCIFCGHGGHTTHIKDWFNKNIKCPTGCGCSCSFNKSEQNSQQQLQLQQPPQITQITQSSNSINTNSNNSTIPYTPRSTTNFHVPSHIRKENIRRYSLSAFDNHHEDNQSDSLFNDICFSPSSSSSQKGVGGGGVTNDQLFSN